MIQEVRVITKQGITDSKGEEVLYDINYALGIQA